MTTTQEDLVRTVERLLALEAEGKDDRDAEYEDLQMAADAMVGELSGDDERGSLFDSYADMLAWAKTGDWTA